MRWYQYIGQDGQSEWSAEPPYRMTGMKWAGASIESDTPVRDDQFDRVDGSQGYRARTD